MSVDLNNQHKFLVTGASGFTGSHLVRYLESQGVAVRALVRTEKDAEKLRAKGVETVIGDLENIESLKRATHGIYGIYHIAAAFRKAGLPEKKFFDINTTGTKNLLDAAISSGTKRFIHCSTVGVLSNVTNPPADETAPYNPAGIYQESKMEGEKTALDYFSAGKISGVVIRPAMIYGPEDMRTLKLFKMISKERFFYVGDGQAYVHFIDVRDLARSFYLAMNKEELNAKIYIISGKRALPLKEMVNIVADKLGVKSPWLHVPVKPMQLLGSLCESICVPLGIEPPIFRRRVDFFTKNRYFSSERARQDLGFEARSEIESEIDDIIHWYQINGFLPAKTSRSLGKDALIQRGLEGDITYWDANAEKNYGFTRDQAIGNISHSLLKTLFPCPLKEINDNLVNNGIWRGELIHTKKDGNLIKVNSTWELKMDPTAQKQIVIETNKYLENIENGNNIDKSRFKAAAALYGAMESNLFEAISTISYFSNKPEILRELAYIL